MDVLLLLMKRKAISGCESASFVRKSLMCAVSVWFVLRNFLRAGVLKNRSSTRIVVPRLQPASRMSVSLPPVIVTCVPRSLSASRVSMVNRETEAMVGSASPRNPSVATLVRSLTSRILLVAWRWMAMRASSMLMPLPLSVTRMKLVPPAIISTSMRVEPASMAFSTSSLMTEAGRSTTSPAAILLIVLSSSRWMMLIPDLPPSSPAPAVYTARSWPPAASSS